MEAIIFEAIGVLTSQIDFGLILKDAVARWVEAETENDRLQAEINELRVELRKLTTA